MLHSSEITADSKLRPWSEWICWGTPYFWNHYFTRTLAVVCAVWFLVGTATVNFVNISVRTRTFSLPSWAGSITVKSIATILRGRIASIGCNAVWSAEICALAVLQWQQCLQYARMYAVMSSQWYLSLASCVVLSMPWWPMSSCSCLRMVLFVFLGTTSCFFCPRLGVLIDLKRIPSVTISLFHCLSIFSVSGLSADFSAQEGAFFLLTKQIALDTVWSLFWRSCSFWLSMGPSPERFKTWLWTYADTLAAVRTSWTWRGNLVVCITSSTAAWTSPPDILESASRQWERSHCLCLIWTSAQSQSVPGLPPISVPLLPAWRCPSESEGYCPWRLWTWNPGGSLWTSRS